MKYDYFERNSAAQLYRIPQGQQWPVEFACGGVWVSSGSFINKSGLMAEGRTSQVNAARAREISGGAPIDSEPDGPRYFYNDIDIYRQTGADTFHYWSDAAGDWDEPCTSGREILTYREITAEKAEALVLEKTKINTPIAALTIPGDQSDFVTHSVQNDNGTFTLTIYRC